jgi:hypothetical protein
VALDDDIDRLYELPLGEFTAARNKLAGRLRKEGDREAAEEVKGLKKPSEPAWAVNQLARANKRKMTALLRAGTRLREAHQAAGGRGGRDELRAAIADERERVKELAALAEPMLGSRPEAKLERVRDALHAAATDENAREAIAAGRLVEDAQAIGLGPFGSGVAEAPADTPARRKPAQREGGAGGARKDDRARRSREAAAAESRKALRTLEAARKQEKAARENADKARRELSRARDQAEEVAKALQGAERRVKEAEARESQAQDKLAAAERASR